MANNLVQNCPTHFKTERAVNEFVAFSLTSDSINKEELSKFNTEALPTWKLSKLSLNSASSNMEHAHELLKIGKQHVKQALAALSSDPTCTSTKAKVYLAEKTHHRLAKLDEKEAAAYFTKATQVYPYSTYFKGAKANI